MPEYTAFPSCCSASILQGFPAGREGDIFETTKNRIAMDVVDAFVSPGKRFITLNKNTQEWCYNLLIGMGWEELDCWPSSHGDGTEVVLLTN